MLLTDYSIIYYARGSPGVVPCTYCLIDIVGEMPFFRATARENNQDTLWMCEPCGAASFARACGGTLRSVEWFSDAFEHHGL